MVGGFIVGRSFKAWDIKMIIKRLHTYYVAQNRQTGKGWIYICIWPGCWLID